MHIAIDDTYGPEIDTGSRYVTGDRRTYVAVIFQDGEVEFIKRQLLGCLKEISSLTGKSIGEFHFVDIYNRNPPWDNLDEGLNLRVIEFFAGIYKKYKWPVLIQTIDNRTFKDHGIEKITGNVDGLDLSNRADLSLFCLLIKVKIRYKKMQQPISLIIDEGRQKAGTSIGSFLFHDWSFKFGGIYESSKSEALLQLADFVAFCVNRSTHLGAKKERTEVDNWFLNLVGNMGINCDDLQVKELPVGFPVDDFDDLHISDRGKKGL